MLHATSVVLSGLLLQWLKMSSDEVKEQIYKLAKKGLTPSQIGTTHSINVM